MRHQEREQGPEHGREPGPEQGSAPGPQAGPEQNPEPGPEEDPAHEPEHTRAHDHDRGPGRPRSAAAERAILDAVIALLEAGEPLAGLSIERIARTAKVGKATIYRRWHGKEELFLDVLRDMEPPDPVVSGTAGLADLRLLMESHRTRGLAQRSSVMLHNVFAQMKSHPGSGPSTRTPSSRRVGPRWSTRSAAPSTRASCGTTSTSS